ncbi:hypothetical protein [Lonepinella sp. BR2357]|uniref:hypothetical protein n=1 Tax=Lonepinella sp. BR2357 TaxID=3434549 RepID=UPI003F6DB20E
MDLSPILYAVTFGVVALGFNKLIKKNKTRKALVEKANDRLGELKKKTQTLYDFLGTSIDLLEDVARKLNVDPAIVANNENYTKDLVTDFLQKTREPIKGFVLYTAGKLWWNIKAYQSNNFIYDIENKYINDVSNKKLPNEIIQAKIEAQFLEMFKYEIWKSRAIFGEYARKDNLNLMRVNNIQEIIDAHNRVLNWYRELEALRKTNKEEFNTKITDNYEKYQTLKLASQTA